MGVNRPELNTENNGRDVGAIVFATNRFLCYKLLQQQKQGWIQEFPVGGADATRAARAIHSRGALQFSDGSTGGRGVMTG